MSPIPVPSRARDLYYGWFVTVACFAALLAVFSINYSFGVFFDPLIADFGSSKADTSLIFSIQSITLYTGAAVFGRQADRYSARPVVVLGGVLTGVGMVGASLSSSLVELYISYGVVAGLGMGMVYVIGITTATRWFHRRRGIASAIATSGVVIATLVAPPVASILIDLYGWQTAYRLLTGCVVLVVVGVAIVIRDNPETAGVDTGTEFEGSQVPASDEAEAETEATIRSVIGTRAFWALFFTWITTTLPIFTVLVYLVTYSTDVGMPRGAGVLGIALMGGFALPGRLLSGVLGDRVGRTRFFVFLSVGLGIGIWTLAFIRNPIVLFVFASGYGLLYGGVGSLYAPIMADFFGRDKVTTFFGISAFAFGIAAFVGPFLAGLSFEHFASYNPFFFGGGALSLLGGVVLSVTNRRRF